MTALRAGILVGGTTCMHCGLAAVRCACAATDPRGPRHGLAEAFLLGHVPLVGTSGPQRA